MSNNDRHHNGIVSRGGARPTRSGKDGIQSESPAAAEARPPRRAVVTRRWQDRSSWLGRATAPVFAAVVVLLCWFPSLLLLRGAPRPQPPPSNLTSEDGGHPGDVDKRDAGAHQRSSADHSNGEDQDAARLPQWMKDYFAWHAEQRNKLDRIVGEYKGHQGDEDPAKTLLAGQKGLRFLVLRSLKSDRRCGGLSDRLKALPLLIRLAARNRRVFLVYWNRPCRLEEFLLPPTSRVEGGSSGDGLVLDWRAPEWLVPTLDRGDGYPFHRTADRIFDAVKGDDSLVSVKLQDQHGGSQYYNDEEGERAHRRVYGPLFRAMFEPSPSLAGALAAERRKYPALAVPGGYAAAHLRAQYVPPLPTEMVPDVAVNAVRCARQLRPTGDVPIFFASDSRLAVEAVKKYGREAPGRSLIVIDRDGTGGDPLHLDKASSRDPQDYYDAFLDLYHLANAECVSYGQGGFGRLGVLLSRNASCLLPFVSQSRLVECHWED